MLSGCELKLSFVSVVVDVGRVVQRRRRFAQGQEQLPGHDVVAEFIYVANDCAQGFRPVHGKKFCIAVCHPFTFCALQGAAEFFPYGAEQGAHIAGVRHHAEVLFAFTAAHGIVALQHDAVAFRLYEE